jgi:7-carboxy-7-deazaguanine synthase
MSPVSTAIPVVDPVLERRVGPLSGLTSGELLIHEIYRSIQGEGTFVGLPCIFVRLTVCHLRCVYCDTPHAFFSGKKLSLDQIFDEVVDLGDSLVEVTGGEPLLQPDVLPLITRLADSGRTVLLETSGALDIEPVDDRARIIMDIKTPGSGEVAANYWPNLKLLKPIDEVKFVVSDRADFDWSVNCIVRHKLAERCPVLIAPVFGKVDATELARWILESRLPLRLQVQLHKLLWEPNARGV